MDETNPIGIGVVGLGQRWQKRYRSAVLKLPELFRIVGVCDQIAQIAAKEARELQCGRAAGIVELLRHTDVQALLLADSQWHGLWSCIKAMEFGKPILCGVLPGNFDGNEYGLEAVNLADAPLLFDLPMSRSPLIVAARDLITSHIGKPSIILCTILEQTHDANHSHEVVSLQYFDLCLKLVQDVPRRVQATGLADGSLMTVLIELSDNCAIQLVRCASKNRPSCRMQILADKGTAWVDFPNRIRWTTKSAGREKILKKKKDSAQELLKEFHQRITSGGVRDNPMAEVVRALQIQQLARRSWKEGCWVNVE